MSLAWKSARSHRCAVIALASASGRQDREELDLAEAAFAAGLFRDISEFERVSKVLAGATKSAQR